MIDQLFRLSFWRHPFTAEEPLLRHWCNATFLQIWWRNKLVYILDGLRVKKFSKFSFLDEQFLLTLKTSVYFCLVNLILTLSFTLNSRKRFSFFNFFFLKLRATSSFTSPKNQLAERLFLMKGIYEVNPLRCEKSLVHSHPGVPRPFSPSFIHIVICSLQLYSVHVMDNLWRNTKYFLKL